MFKIHSFLRFLQHPKRRDVRELKSCATEQELVSCFGSINLKSTRRALENNGETRAAFMGSFLSSAARFNGPGLEDFSSDVCCLCQASQGTMSHQFWGCAANPPLVQRPDNLLQRRFGWHVQSKPLHYNTKVVGHFAGIIRRIWDTRHSG